MGYVGRGLNQDGGQYRKLDSIESSFDGSEVNFTLKIDGLEVSPTAQNLMISLGGVVQEPGTAFSVSGATITFATAPDEDATFFGVLMGEASFIAANTVGSNEMGVTAGAVTGSKGIVVDTAKNIIGLNNVSASKFEGTFDGALSSSAQLAANISGSFSKEHLGAKVANVVTSSAQIAADISGSFGNQRVGTSDSPTFAGGTITGDFSVGGTITAQEVHTEFESASILFTSGSTKFGDTSNDTHSMTGSLLVSGSITMADGDLSVTDDVVFGATATVETGLNLESGTFTIKNATGDTNGLKISQGGSDASNILNHYNGTLNLGVANSVDMTLKSGRVGIGDTSPGSPLDVKSGEAANTANFNSTSGATNITLESNGSLIGQMEFSGAGPSQIVTRTSASLALGSNNVKTLYITDDDRVGIGVASPAYTFDLASGDAIVSQFTGTSGETILSLDNTSTNGDKWYLISGGSGGSFAGGKFGIYNADTTTAVATFTNDGNVSIGTTGINSNAKVHIRGGDSGQTASSNNTQLTIESNAAAGIQLLTGTTSVGGIWVGDSNGAEAGGKLYYSNNNDRWSFYNASSTLGLSISTTGIGIGEEAPYSKVTAVETESKAAATFYNTRNPSSSPPHCLDLNFAYTPDNTTSYFIKGSDNLGSSATAEFHVYSDGSFVQSSDRRKKENIVDSENQLDKINQLKVRDYNKINDSSKKKHIGFIAQELQEVFPHLVIEAEDEAKTLQVYKIGIVPLLVKAVQELSAQNEALTARIEALEK